MEKLLLCWASQYSTSYLFNTAFSSSASWRRTEICGELYSTETWIITTCIEGGWVNCLSASDEVRTNTAGVKQLFCLRSLLQTCPAMEKDVFQTKLLKSKICSLQKWCTAHLQPAIHQPRCRRFFLSREKLELESEQNSSFISFSSSWKKEASRE